MTCQELRLHFEDPLRLDAAFAEEADHLALCEECARFVELQGQLGAGLRLARETGPRFPASLDAAILAGYRQRKTDRAPRSNPELRRRVFAVLHWSAAAAVAAVVALLVFQHLHHIPFSQAQRARAVAPDSAVAATVPISVGISPSSSTSGSSAENRAIHIPRSHQARDSNLGRTAPSAPSVATLESSRPATFRSLMYCDEISCGEGLDIIRVQLPPSVTAFAPGSGSSGPVFADVLVGADGIARGIRIVQ
jgi:hypothetical protein